MILYNHDTGRITGTYYLDNSDFDVALCDQITDNLWLGGFGRGQKGILLPPVEHVISLYWPYKIELEGLKTHVVCRFQDSQAELDSKMVTQLAQWVNICRSLGPTYVHCQVGLNRSGLVAATALVLDGMEPDDAVDLLRDKRSTSVLCNPVFEKWVRSIK